MLFYDRVMCPNDADGLANSVDADQTAPSGADQSLHCLPIRIVHNLWHSHQYPSHVELCRYVKILSLCASEFGFLGPAWLCAKNEH